MHRQVKLARKVAFQYLLKTSQVHKRALRVKQLATLMGKGKQFGVLSGYGTAPKKQNKIRHGELIQDLQKLGYHRYTNLKGKWEGVSEKALLVPGMEPQHLFDLGRKYTQDAVIYKGGGVLGLYYTKGTPRASLAVRPDGDMAYQLSLDPDLFSKSRGLSFEFGFIWEDEVPWDGKNPMTKADVDVYLNQRLVVTA